MHMTADGCAYLVAEVCVGNLEYWDNTSNKTNNKFWDSRLDIRTHTCLRFLNLEP